MSRIFAILFLFGQLQSGNDLFDKGQYADAIAEYEKALGEKLPEQLRLMLELQLERVRGAVGKLEGALSVFGKPRS